MALIRPGPFWDWKGLMIEVALKGSLLLGLVTLGMWLWPDSIPNLPVTLVPITDWLWAFAAAWVGVLFILACYFIVVIPLLGFFYDGES